MSLIPQIFSEKQELENNDFQVISYYSNGKKIENKQLENEEINLYFGMIYEKENSFYSENFIVGAIENAFKKTNGKINIELGGELSKIMNAEIIEGIKVENIQKQKEKILKIIKKHFNKIEQEKININIINNKHNEIFERLKEENGFKIEEKELEEIKNKNIGELTSLDIYKILYLESKKNNKLFKLSANIQTTHIKEKRNERASYYSLAEVAIRLKDLIDGKIIQGGENRQKRYDTIINKILNKEYKSETLEILYKLLKDNNIKSENFKQFYINKQELENQEENQKKLKQVNKKIRNFIGKTVLGVSLIIGGPVAGYKYNQYQTEQKIQTRLDKLKQDEINQIGGANIDGIVENIQKNQKFEKKVLKYFIGKYGLGDFENKNELLIVLRDGINNYKTQELSEIIREKYPNFNNKQEEFLYQFNKIVDSIKNTLTLNGINLVSPLGKFEDFSEEINNTLNADTQQIKFLGKQFVNDIEKITLANGKEVEVGIIRCKQQGASPGTNYSICKGIKGEKSFFGARYKGTNTKFSLELAQKVIQELQK